jgi:hypothetical protein
MHTRVAEPWRLTPSSSGWTLLEHDRPVRTPLGTPVASRHRPLARRMLENLRNLGGHALFPPTPYSLQVLYLDFARSLPPARLAELVVSNVQGGTADREARRQVVAGLSPRALLAAMAFDAHFDRPNAGLNVITGRADLDALSADLCAFVAERRIGHGLEGSGSHHAPVGDRDEGFCRAHCLPTIAAHPSGDGRSPERTPSRCGTRRTLEGFRFFASFPEE